MEWQDLKNLGDKDLHNLLAEKREEARSLRFKATEKQLKSVRTLRLVKKTIARVLTLINARRKQ